MNCPVQLIVVIFMIKSAYSQVSTSNDIPGTLKCEGCSIYKLTENDKKEILFAHNSLRDKLSQGIEGMGNPRPQLKAINLEHLQWDEVLEEEAWNELYSCSSDPDFRKCFTDLSNPVTGHNYDYIVNSSNSSDSVLSIVKKWSSQANTFNHEHASSLTASDLTAARAYTQMVWSRSTKIGCAAFKEKIVEYTDMTHLICKYREPGNIIGQPVYFTSSTVLHQPPTGINSMTTNFKTNIPNLPTNDGQIISSSMISNFNTNSKNFPVNDGQIVTGDMTSNFNTNIPNLPTNDGQIVTGDMTSNFNTNIPNLPTNDGQIVTGDMTSNFNTNIPNLPTNDGQIVTGDMTSNFNTNMQNLPTNDGQIVTGDMTSNFNTNMQNLPTKKGQITTSGMTSNSATNMQNFPPNDRRITTSGMIPNFNTNVQNLPPNDGQITTSGMTSNSATNMQNLPPNDRRIVGGSWPIPTNTDLDHMSKRINALFEKIIACLKLMF